VERHVERTAERLVLAEEPAQELERQRADRFVRVRDADEQRRPCTVADREQLDRPPFRRPADRLDPRDARMGADERRRACRELVAS